MKIVNYMNQEDAKNPHGIQSKQLYSTEDAQVMHLLIKPEEGLKLHITPVDVFFYILEGQPHITVGDETIQVKVDDLVESPKDIPHTITNNTDANVRVLVAKTPRPGTKTQILDKK